MIPACLSCAAGVVQSGDQDPLAAHRQGGIQASVGTGQASTGRCLQIGEILVPCSHERTAPFVRLQMHRMQNFV